MKGSKYVPNRGDIIWLNFSPQNGNEQRGMRPALVLSPLAYNKKFGLAVVCPITKQEKGYPFEVSFIAAKISGVVLSDHVRSVDWRVRQANFIGKIKWEYLEEVLDKLGSLIKG